MNQPPTPIKYMYHKEKHYYEDLLINSGIILIIYLKPKVTLHRYNIYLFWVFVSGILNVFDSY